MVSVVLYKYLNSAAGKTILEGHTVLTVTINYRIKLSMMLLITSMCKSLKADPSREICTSASWLKTSFAKHPDKLLYVCYCSIKKCLVLWDVIRNDYLAAPRPNLTLNGMLNKKNYMLKMILLHPNLATNARVVFKLCS